MARKTTKATEEKVTAEVKEEVKTVKETAPAKETAAAKKAPAKKAVAKADEPVIKCTIEFAGKNTAVRSIVDNIFEIEGGKDAVKTLEIYIQPENNVAYYVANGKEEGKSVEF